MCGLVTLCGVGPAYHCSCGSSDMIGSMCGLCSSNFISYRAGQPPRSCMTNLSTVPYAHEPRLIARLLGMVLEAAHAYGVSCKVIAYMKNCVHVSFPVPTYSITVDFRKCFCAVPNCDCRSLGGLFAVCCHKHAVGIRL